MNITEIIFSPTGGTQKAADAITEEWGGHINKIDLTDPEADFAEVNFSPNDVVLVAVPSYGGRVPSLASERLIKIHGNQARCVLVCVYGNRAYEDTLVELQDIAEKCNFKVIAAAAAIAEHSIMHQYAAGRPDMDDKRELHSFGQRILEKIKENSMDSAAALKIPGNRPYKKAGGASLVPKADDNCNGCSLCAANCPAKAISRENLKAADHKKCISCMRCVVQCPQGARKVNETIVFAAALVIKKACSGRKSNQLYI